MKKIKILNKIALRNLLKNKKQTLTIILDLIVICTSIFSVLLLFSSYQHYMINSVLEKDNWDTKISKVKYEDYKKIKDNDEIKEISKTYNIETTNMPSEGMQTVYIDIYSYDKNAMENLLKSSLKEGRLPENESEIAISNANLDSNDINLGNNYYKVGDKIKIGENKEYTIVGVLNETKYDKASMVEITYGAITYLNENTLENDEIIDIYISNKNIKNVYETAKNISSELQIQENNISYNEELLNYSLVSESRFKESFYLIAITLLLVIALSSIILIHTTLSILLNLRKKEIGELLSIGCNKVKIIKMILFEVFILTLITIPISFLLSLGITKIILSNITNLLTNLLIQDYNIFIAGGNIPLKLSISLEYIIIAILFMLLTIFVSTIIPAIKISKISPIETIKSTDRTILKKNMVMVILSLVICIIVFIVGSNYISNIYARIANDNRNYNYLIYLNNDEQYDEVIADLKTKNLVKSYYGMEKIRDLHLNISEQNVNNELTDFMNSEKALEGVFYNLADTNKPRLSSTIFTIVENDKYADLLEKLEIKELKDGECVLLNNIDLPNYASFHVTNYKENDTISLLVTSLVDNLNPNYLEGTSIYNQNEITNEQAIKNIDLKLNKVTDDFYGYFNYTEFTDLYNSPVAILVNKNTLKSISDEINKQSNEFYNNGGGETQTEINLYINSTNPNEVENYLSQNNISGINYEKQNQSNNNKSMIMQVFLYSFITLIAICTFLNIFNIIYTNITSRKKDFAILKSLGMTKKQLNKMLYLEGLRYSGILLVIGITLGIIGFVIIYKVEYEINKHFLYDLSISWQSILACVIFVIVTIFLAIWGAKRKIKYENLIKVIKGH